MIIKKYEADWPHSASREQFHEFEQIINQFNDKDVKVTKKDGNVLKGKLRIIEKPDMIGISDDINCKIQVGEDSENVFEVIREIESIEIDNATGGKKKKSRKQKNKSRKTKKSRKSRPLKN